MILKYFYTNTFISANNAYYLTDGTLLFGYFDENGVRKYACRSFDVIAHETGN